MNTQARSSYIRKQITSPDVKRTIISDIKPNQQIAQKRQQEKRNINSDKQNMISIENIQPQLRENKSPKNIKTGLKQLQIRSPDRPIYMPSGFRSNKAAQCTVDINNSLQKKCQNKQSNQKTTIYSGLSKDGRYQISSIALSGKQLQKAKLYQLKTNLTKKPQQYLLQKNIPIVQPSKISIKQNGLIKSYAVNTHQGISRNYNQDRVSIILNINKNNVKSSFFAIYDGHGGTGCADFLRDYLHQYIINHSSFPQDPKKAIVDGIHRVEAKFIELVKKKYHKTNQLDRSGSCAIIVMMVANQCYIVNVGDSRAFLSKNNGKVISHLSRDHKPTDERQQKRIISNGGQIYRTQMIRVNKLNVQDKSTLNDQQFIIGPLRVFPGKLSVTRTFGDIEAKDKDFQGIANCVSVQPQIAKFTVDRNDDYIFLGCDGIFQKLQSIQVNKLIWKSILDNKKQSLHEISGSCVDQVIIQSMRRKSTDNLTGILINLKDYYIQNICHLDQKTLIKDMSCKSL